MSLEAEVVTARELEIKAKASGSFKNVYFCDECPDPVYVLSGNSFKTGKHGKGKTRLLCVKYFTDQKISLLVDSALAFYNLHDSVNYKAQEVVCVEITDTTLSVLNNQYETIYFQKKEEHSKFKEGTQYILETYTIEDKIFRKLKQI